MEKKFLHHMVYKKKRKENKISHKCSTDSGSSGAPILLVKNNKVI